MKNLDCMLLTSSSHSGFTLIEMMITLLIISILAAIAIPSYRQYTVRNAESQALAQIRQIEMELNGWRATSLTYKGFRPKQIDNTGNIIYSYADSGTNTKIYVPNSATSKYTIRLTVDSAGTTSLVPTSTSAITTVYNTWVMYAEPASSISNYGAKKMILNNNGVGCKSATNSFSASTTSCTASDEIGLDK